MVAVAAGGLNPKGIRADVRISIGDVGSPVLVPEFVVRHSIGGTRLGAPGRMLCSFGCPVISPEETVRTVRRLRRRITLVRNLFFGL